MLTKQQFSFPFSLSCQGASGSDCSVSGLVKAAASFPCRRRKERKTHAAPASPVGLAGS